MYKYVNLSFVFGCVSRTGLYSLVKRSDFTRFQILFSISVSITLHVFYVFCNLVVLFHVSMFPTEIVVGKL